MLQALYVHKEMLVQDNALTHVYNLSGELCATDAVWLKETLQKFPQREDIILDLSQIRKVDLTAINALAQGHKKHRLSVVLPVRTEAAALFHLTKFTDILTTLPALQAYRKAEIFA